MSELRSRFERPRLVGAASWGWAVRLEAVDEEFLRVPFGKERPLLYGRLQAQEGRCLADRIKRHTERLLQPFAWDPAVICLPYPNLRHELDVYGREGSMQCAFVQKSVHGSGKEYQRRASPRRHLKVQSWKLRLPAIDAVVQIHEHRHDSLTPIGGEPPSVVVAQIEGVKVLESGTKMGE